MLGHPQPALFFQGWGGGRFPDISLAQNRCKCEGQRTTVGEFGQHLLIHQQQLGIQPNDCCAFPFLTYFRCSILRIPCLIPPSLCSFTRGLWTRRGRRLWRVPSSVHIRRRKIRVQLFSSFRSTQTSHLGLFLSRFTYDHMIKWYIYIGQSLVVVVVVVVVVDDDLCFLTHCCWLHPGHCVCWLTKAKCCLDKTCFFMMKVECASVVG